MCTASATQRPESRNSKGTDRDARNGTAGSAAKIFPPPSSLDSPLALLNSLAQLFGKSFHLAHGHNPYALAGEKLLHEHVPRIVGIRPRIGDRRDFREAVARVNAARRVSQSLRLRQIAPQRNRLDKPAHSILVAVIQTHRVPRLRKSLHAHPVLQPS